MGDGIRKYQGKSTGGAAALDTGGAAGTWMPSGVQGLDVSVHQATVVVPATKTTPAVYEDRVDWRGQKAKGAQFAYVKATEGDYYRSPMWQSQFNNTYNVGMIRGSYHFAIPHPDAGTAADQARYFVANGGVWSADGKTLPPLLDIEYNPYVDFDGVNYYGNTCYDRTPAQMVAWIREFSDTVYALKGRLPAIYTTTDWWRTCVGNNGGFSGNPLHIASYFENAATSPGVIPNGWVGHDIWQYSSTGPFVGDSNVWRGTLSQLQSFAAGVTVNTGGAIGQTWVAAGGADGPWGRATSEERCDASLCQQVFERRMAYWTAQRGVLSVATSGAIGSVWRSAGAAASRFGLPTGSEACTDSYCLQNFQTGDLYWSAGTGVQSMYYGTDNSTIGAYWKKQGGPSSKYGLPTSSESCASNYCVQYFERGSIYWTSGTGIQPVFTAGDNSTVGGAWIKLGGANSKFGFPTSSEQCYSNYCEQTFQRGRILWNVDVGVQAVFTNGDNSTIGGLWVKAGATTSRYGFPNGPETCTVSSCQQRFQFGTIVWSPAGGVQPLFYSTDNSTVAAYFTLNLGGATGKYGFPIGADICQADLCVQKFQFGNVYWTPATGIQPVFTNGDNSTVGGAWIKQGGTNSKYGYPASAEKCYANYCEQTFQRGLVLWSAAGGVQPVFTNGDNSTVGGLWVKSGAAASRYGYPIGPETCSATSCQQRFQYGTIVWSAAGGIQPLFYSNDNSTISAHYTLNLGGIAGKYGFPVSAETCQNNTCVQKFQYGNVYWSAAGGIQPVWTNSSTATIGGYYESLGGPASPLSYPASAEQCKGTTCFQRFLSGYVTWTAATGLQTVNTTKEIGKAWLGQGGVNGALGVPRDREQCSGTTSCTQNFANGTIRWTSTGGISITKNP